MNKKTFAGFALTSLLALPGVVTAQSPYFQAVTNLNPIAYWPLQETAQPPAADVEMNLGSLGAVANAYYSSTNTIKGVQGAIAGDADSAVNFQSGLNGSFLAVPMTDSRVSLPVGPFTVEAWIYPTNANSSTIIGQTGPFNTGGLNNGPNSGGWSLNQNYLPVQNNANLTGWSFHVYNGVGASGGAEATIVPPALTLNTWYHIVAVFDGVNITMYLNGAPATAYRIPMTGSYVRDTWTPLTIGCGRGLNNNRFGGKIDEVAIYTAALTPEQVAAHYQAGTGGAGGYSSEILANNPYMYWRLNASAASVPGLNSYPSSASYGSVNAGGIYMQGTIPGVPGPSYAGFGAPSYACAFNGIGSSASHTVPYFTNGNPVSFSITAGSGVVITNLSSPLNLTSNHITAMVWFKSNPADSRFQSLIGHGDSSWRFSLDGTTGRLRWNPGQGGELTSTRTYNDGKWHFVAGVYTNTGTVATGTNILYVDGVLDVSGAVTTAATGSTTNILLGGAPDYNVSGNGNTYRQRLFSGSLAHAAYFTNALSAAMIQSLYDAAQPPPAILVQAATSVTNTAGATNNFTVVNSGANPKTFQWYYNTANSFAGATPLSDGTDANGSLVSGATSGSLTIENLKIADGGYYFLTINNNYGAVTSSISRLTVLPNPYIAAETPGATLKLFPNQRYTLSVTAGGTGPFTYQWLTNGAADTLGGKASTYTINSAQPEMSGNTYQCVVTGSDGSVTNTLCTLTVTSFPASLTGSLYASSILGLNPDGYWPMHEVAPQMLRSVETNLGSLGNLADGYYSDWMGGSTNILHQTPGALAGDSDTSTTFPQSGFLVIPRTSPGTTLKPPFTIECWTKPLSTAFGDIVGQGPFGQNRGSTGGIRYGVRLAWGGNFQVYVGNGTTTDNPSFATGNYQAGQWMHVGLTFDGTNWNLYVNGDLAKTAALPMGINTADPICVGNAFWDNGGPARQYNGAIDEVAIYPAVLSQSQLQTHYNAGINSSPNPAYKQQIQSDNPLIYLRMNAPAQELPPTSTWAVLTNYGKVALNGVYSPGSRPGAAVGSGAQGFPMNLSSANVMPGNGVNSYADAGFDQAFNPTTNAFSFTAWFKGNPADSRSFQTIMGHSDSSWRVAINQAGKVQAHAGANDVSPGTLYNDGNWHHLVMSYSGVNGTTGTNILYVDGVQVGTSTGGGNAGSTMNVMLGNDPQFTNNPVGIGRAFAGQVCEVAFWNDTVITPTQVQALYSAAGALPYITKQPVSASRDANSAFTNTVSAIGSPPLSYQWYQSGVPRAGQTNSALILNPVEATDGSPSWYVVVSNGSGSVTSSVVSLIVYSSPSISQQPLYTNLVLFPGSHPTLTVAATGAQPMSYQWISNDVPIIGANSPSYTLVGLKGGTFGTYYCQVANSAGSANSLSVNVTVLNPPTDPRAQTVLNDNPIGYWRLNEADNGNGNQGAVSHDYWGGNNGVYANTILGETGYSSETSALFGYFAIDNCAISGISGIDVSAPAGTSAAFSVEAWVKGAAQGTVNTGIAAKGYFNNEEFTLDTGAPSRAYRFQVRNASAASFDANSTLIADDFIWHHLVGVCDQPNGKLNLYIDGKLAASTSMPPGSGIWSGNAGVPMTIGARPSNANSGNNNQFIGWISDVAVYKHALSADDVAAHFMGRPTISVARSGEQMVITYIGTLLSSTNVAGPYLPVPGAMSPYVITPSGAQNYYRTSIANP